MSSKEVRGITAVYVLTKNEEVNIGKCLSRLYECGASVIVLDSGSEDRTREICSEFKNCKVQDFAFKNHTETWNLITGVWHRHSEYVMILDADMEVSCSLWSEAVQLTYDGPDVILAPVRMYVEGRPLKFGSLYPPKAVVFRGGEKYFLPKGHCSQLRSNIRTCRTSNYLIHNDLKPYSAYLMSQVRYGRLLYERFEKGLISWKDWLRATSPLMALIFPLVSLFVRGGVLAGKTGLIYALDRSIAALVQYRTVLACSLRENLQKTESTVGSEVT